jgi:hypothetical protein
MPTNKLWIEHTERAAWDSVEALRERLLKAEQRLQALAPHVDRLPELLDALEQAKQKLSLDRAPPDEVVASLVARIDAHPGELNAARAAATTIIDFGSLPPRPRLDPDELDEPPSDRFEDAPDLVDDFTRAMRRHESEARRDGELPRDLNRLLALAETKLDDLTELEGGALREAALDLALIAARVHAASRRKT